MPVIVARPRCPVVWQDCHVSNDSCQTVAVIAIPEVVAFDLAIPCQVFGHRDERRRYALRVCSEGGAPVPTTTGIAVVPTGDLSGVTDAETVIVPGYVADADRPSPAVLDALRAADARGARVVSICTGAFALAAAGLLDGQRATTHWRDAARLAERHPAVAVDPDVLYLRAAGGRRYTSAGVAAGIDLCLHLVRGDHGAERANAIARRMVVAPLREGGQAQFVPRPVPAHAHDSLAATRAWMLARLHEPLTVAEVARQAGHSPRSLHRHFLAQTGRTPLQWLLAQRVLEAQRLLQETQLPVDEVAARAGFGTATALRTHLRRALRTTPTAYRRAWLAREPAG
jgi:transcriptional regulator GlxA family with amidase domain